MISANDFRKGITFEIDGQPYVVVDFQHVKPGKGAAFVRTTYRNIITGATREEAFNPSDRFNRARIEKKNMQYLYNDGANYIFMDNETYEQLELSPEQVEDVMKDVRENDSVDSRGDHPQRRSPRDGACAAGNRPFRDLHRSADRAAAGARSSRTHGP